MTRLEWDRAQYDKESLQKAVRNEQWCLKKATSQEQTIEATTNLMFLFDHLHKVKRRMFGD